MKQAPLSAYLHLPWCVRKCPYCDFNSHAGTPDEVSYVDAMRRDIDFELSQRERWPGIRSIFIGGGTPSLFSATAIGQMLDHLAGKVDFHPDIEITIEANPGTVDAAHFRGYRSLGINRLSIGIQSFDNPMLTRLGRIHDRDAAVRAFEEGRRAGFDNINIDLMHGLPDQSLEQALHDLKQGLQLQPEHLSWYQLTIEPNTEFGQRPPRLPDDDLCGEIEDEGFRLLDAAGLRRYEISAFARIGRRSQHNLNYWRFGDYLGLGAGAHGKLTLPQGVRRRARLRSPQRFMSRAGSADVLASESWPEPEQLLMEFALNTLRVDGGFTRARFEGLTGLEFAKLAPSIAQAESLGLARLRKNAIHTTALGRRHLNRLLECFAENTAFK